MAGKVGNSNFQVELMTRLDTTGVGQQIQQLNLQLKKSSAVEIRLKNGAHAIKEVNQLSDAFGNLYIQEKRVTENGYLIDQNIKKVSNSVKILETQTDKWSTKMGKVVTNIKTLDTEGNILNKRIREYTNAQGYAVKETQLYDEAMRPLGKATVEMAKDQTVLQKNMTQTTSAIKTQYKATKSLAQSFGETVVKVAKFYVATIPIQLVQKALSDSVEVIKDYDKAMTEFQKVTSLSSESVDRLSQSLKTVGEETGNTLTKMTDIATTLTKAGYGADEQVLTQLSKMVALYINTSDEEINAADAASVLISQMKAFGDTTQEVEHYLDAINKVSAEFAVSSGDLGKGLTAAGAALSTYGNSYDETIALLTSGTEVFQNKSQQVARALNAVASRVVKNEEALNDLKIETRDSNGELLSTYEILKNLSPKWQRMASDEKVSLGITLAGVNQYKVFAAVMNNFSQAVKAKEAAEQSAGMTEKQNSIYMQSLEALTDKLKTQYESLVLGKGGLQDLAKTLIVIATGVLKVTNSIGGLPTLLMAIGTALLYIKGIDIISSIKESVIAIGNLVTSLFSVNAVAQQCVGTMATLNASMGAVGLVLTALVAGYNLLKNAQEEYWRDSAEQSRLANEESVKLIDSQTEIVNKIKDESLSREQLNSILKENIKSYDEEENRQLSVNELRERGIELLEEEKRKRAETIYADTASQYRKAQNNLSQVNVNDTDISPYYTLRYASNTLGDYSGIGELGMTAIDSSKGYEELIENLENYKQLLVQISEETDNLSTQNQALLGMGAIDDIIDSLNSKFATQIETIDNTNEALGQLGYKYQENINGKFELVQMTDLEKEAFANSNRSVEGLAQSIQELTDYYNVSVDELREMSDVLGVNDAYTNDEEYVYALIEAYVGLQEQAEETKTSLTDLVTELSGMQDNYNTLQDAVNQYNKIGAVSASTLKALLALDSEYQDCLMATENGLALNEQGFLNLAEAQKQEIIQQIALDTYMELINLALDDQKEKTDNSAKSVEDASAKYRDGAVALEELAAGAIDASATVGALSEVLKGNDVDLSTLSSETISKMNESLNAGIAKIKLVNSLQNEYASNYAASSSKSASSSKDAWLEAYKEEKDALDNLYKTGQISAEEYYSRLYALGEKYFQDTEAHRKKYIEEWRDVEEEVYKGLKDTLKDYIDLQKDQFKAVITQLKDQKSKALEAIKAEKSAKMDAINAELKALKRQKESVQKYWDERIDALKRQNEELDKQNKLMEYQEALAKAQQTKVMLMGENGRFEYGMDESAVSEAQQNLNDYQQQLLYEQELQSLEDSRDKALAVYEQKIQDLEDYKDRMEEYYESQLEATEQFYDAQIEATEKALEQFEAQAERLLNDQMQQVDSENIGWKARLKNLADFINQYNTMLTKLGQEGVTVKSSYQGTSSTSVRSEIAKSQQSSAKVGAHADGIPKIHDEDITIVGEDPNKEIVLGSKINNGVAMHLGNGAGVVNAKSTSTLAGMLNMIGDYAKSGFGSGNGVLTNNSSKTNTTHINIDTIKLDNVTDGKSFVDYLQNFSLDMTQRSYA